MPEPGIPQATIDRATAMMTKAGALFGGTAGKGEAKARMETLLPELERCDDLTLGVILGSADVLREASMHLLERRIIARRAATR